MKAAPPLPLSTPEIDLVSAQPTASRVSAFIALTKPRLTAMVLITVACGFVLGAQGGAHPLTLLAAVVGTGLVAGGAGALNMVLERDRDRLMRRTASRPIPTGLISPVEGWAFGLGLGMAGTLLLLAGTNQIAATLAVATFVLYVWVYTPLKTRSTLNTAVGAIPGALPPVIGWAAATGRIGIEAVALFLILFLWQFPHFLAIAWIHRRDYAGAGYRMLPALDPSGVITARQAAVHALVLIPVGLLPASIGLAGPFYALAAILMGLHYFRASARFLGDPCDASARKLLRASLIYLPLVLFMLMLNPLPA